MFKMRFMVGLTLILVYNVFFACFEYLEYVIFI